MSQLGQEQSAARPCNRRHDGAVAVAAAGAAAVVWWVLTGPASVDLAVRSGSGERQVGVVSVIVTAVVVALAGGGLLRVLERRRGARGVAAWTVTAVAVLAVSLAGPLGAASPAAGLGLALLHLVVGAVVVVGLRAGRRGAVA